jgi:hypothetical protein
MMLSETFKIAPRSNDHYAPYANTRIKLSFNLGHSSNNLKMHPFQPIEIINFYHTSKMTLIPLPFLTEYYQND